MAKVERRKRPHGGPGQMMPGEKAKDFKGTFKKLLGCLKPYKIQLGFVILFAIVSTVFNIVSPSVLGDATDEIVKGLFSGMGIDFTALGKIALTLIGLYVISATFQFGQAFIMSKTSQQITYTLRQQMSEKFDKLPLKYFDSKTHGELQSRVVNDIETINQTLNSSITQIITSVTMIIGILIMMIRISVIMTLVALLVLPMSMVVIKLVVGKSQGHFKNQQKYLGAANGHVEEMFTGQNVVKLFNKQKDATEEFDDINGKLCESAWKSQFLSGMMMPITGFIGNLGYVMVCVLGGYLAVNGKVSIGDIQAFIQYVRNFNQPVQQVANITNLLQSTAAAAERVFEVIEAEEEEDAYQYNGEEIVGCHFESKAFKRKAQEELDAYRAENPSPIHDEAAIARIATTKEVGHVEFDHVSFGYKEGETVIKDFSFDVKPGQRVAIVGPTGAGKTTIVKLLMRYYELNGGHIRIDGKDIKDYSRQELRGLFGMVLQDTWLFSGTIRDNLKYGNPNATDEEMIEAAKASRIHHYIMTQPKGYDDVINEEASNLSQGQKQILTICRAMIADNPILILDEATSSVDTRTERHIQEAMANLMKGRTNFVIAHRLSTIKDADTILVLNEGDIVEQGSHEELLAKGGFYAKLYNSQFEEA